MAALQQQYLEGNTQKLWTLRIQPDQLAALGITSQELQQLILMKYGTSAEALTQLAALVATKQVAAMEGGSAGSSRAPPPPQQRWQPPPQQPAAAPAAAQGQAGGVPPSATAQQPQGYVPSWRAQQQAQQAAATQQYQQPPPQAEQQQEQPASASLGRPPPSTSSQQANGSSGGGGASSWAERRAQWQQQQQQGQPNGKWQPQQPQQQGAQAQQQQPPQQRQGAPRASIRDLLNERKMRLPQYAPGTYNHLLCPECLGGDKGAPGLAVCKPVQACASLPPYRLCLLGSLGGHSARHIWLHHLRPPSSPALLLPLPLCFCARSPLQARRA
jgi:hypothetical protein